MLTVVLDNPATGVVSPYLTGGSLDYVLDRYPRWNLTASLRPDPDAVHLWQTPYGTRAHVVKPDGSLLFSGPVIESRISRPDGVWTIQAADDTALLARYRTSNRPGQFLAGTTMTVKQFIEALAAEANVPVTVVGDLGTVDVQGLDIAGAEAWSLVEEQLIANNLDVYPQGDGSLLIAPTATIKTQHDHLISVGLAGTITSYTVSMSRIYNRVTLTYEATKDGATDTKYIDGVWTDSTSSAGTAIGIAPYTRTVRVGADWYDDPAGHQAQADAAAAAVAQTIRGWARAADIEMVPRYDIAVGSTVLVTFLSGASDKFLVTAASWPLEVDGVLGIQVRNPDPDWPGSTFFAERQASDAR
jgi:hypothetical protein